MEELGLYIHIPFCERKCHYCAFSSIPGAAQDQIDAYFEALLKEIESWSGKRIQVRTVYFGGGTPSCVPTEKIGSVVKKLESVFKFNMHDAKIEKTIEVNPGSATNEKLRQYDQLGFNRLSMGLQAAQNHLLKSTGRIHEVSDFINTVSNAEKIGFMNISADLLFGLPEQSLKDIDESIELMTAFKQIKHISCYSLSIEPGTYFDHLYHSGKLNLPDENLEREMYHRICKKLEGFGFHQYEISNFAKKGYESRHNSSYWDLTPYIGLGASASSYYNNRRYQNISDPFIYSKRIMNRENIREEEHFLTDRERRGDFMFLGLRRTEGVSDQNYRKMFSNSFFEDYGDEIDRLTAQGLLLVKGDRILLSSKGTDLANQVFMAFV